MADKKKKKKKQQNLKKKTGPPKEFQDVLDLKLIDLRVGKIDDLEKTPFEKRWVADIDIDLPCEAPRRYATVDGYQGELSTLEEKMVIVALNLPVRWRGFDLNARIMCVKKDDKVELLEPPPTAVKGDRVFAEGFEAQQHYLIKEKNYLKIITDLKVNSEGQAVFRDVPLQVKHPDEGIREGFITAKSITDCPISCLYYGGEPPHEKEL